MYTHEARSTERKCCVCIHPTDLLHRVAPPAESSMYQMHPHRGWVRGEARKRSHAQLNEVCRGVSRTAALESRSVAGFLNRDHREQNRPVNVFWYKENAPKLSLPCVLKVENTYASGWSVF